MVLIVISKENKNKPILYSRFFTTVLRPDECIKDYFNYLQKSLGDVKIYKSCIHILNGVEHIHLLFKFENVQHLYALKQKIQKVAFYPIHLRIENNFDGALRYIRNSR